MLSLLQKACQGRRTAYSAHFTPFQEVFSEKHHASFAENARFFAEQGEDTSYPVRLLTVRAPAITKTHGISRSQAHLYRNKNLPMSTIQSSVKFRTLIVACYSHFFSGVRRVIYRGGHGCEAAAKRQPRHGKRFVYAGFLLNKESPCRAMLNAFTPFGPEYEGLTKKHCLAACMRLRPLGTYAPKEYPWPILKREKK